MKKYYLTIDLGASSGRVIVVEYDQKLILHEISRFEVKQKQCHDDLILLVFDELMTEILQAIKKAFVLYPKIESIGIDTWGVDYGYINHEGVLLNSPRFYRSLQTKRSFDLMNKIINPEALYLQTGIQQMYFNSIYQMMFDKTYHEQWEDHIDVVLMLPDLIAYFLSGNKRSEITNFSTTGLYDPKKRDVVSKYRELIYQKDIFAPFINPGEVYGYLKKEFQLPRVPIIAVCSHDTASAIVSLKVNDNEIYISSGTWSLLGTLLENPITDEEAYQANFTNEIGFNHTIRFLKNINAMYIANQSLKEFQKDTPGLNFSDIQAKIKETKHFNAFIDVNDSLFDNTKNMLINIREYCRQTKQEIPWTVNEVFRTIYASIAYKYKEQIGVLEKITHRQYEKIYILGGGSQNEVVNQLTANITGLKVETGAVEATVLGNAIVQMLGLKHINDISEGQELIKKSTIHKVYQPQDINFFEMQHKKYVEFTKKEGA